MYISGCDFKQIYNRSHGLYLIYTEIIHLYVRIKFDLQLKEGLHGSSQHYSLIYIYQMTLRMPLSDVNQTDGLSVFYSDKSIS